MESAAEETRSEGGNRPRPSSITQRLSARKLAQTPKWLPGAVAYETIMGSVAYGVSSDTSDMDVYGFCIPPKDKIFPHLAGEIPGFGRQIPRFEVYQQHHINDSAALGGSGRQYDLTLFSIVKFFQLALENNPNILDSLFTPVSCVLHATAVGERVREQRRLFLHRGAWQKFKGYAFSQVHKMDIKTPQPGSKRAADVERFGFDAKFAYHIVRLLDEVEQILTTGDLDLQRDRERLKAIRRGEWTAEQVREFFVRKERELETAYAESRLPHSPNEAAIKQLLLECLEAHFGSLEQAVVVPSQERELLAQIRALCEKAGV
ncbi:MAG: nucleotidyltransferase domain-containing protein [Cytophagales bacterium]|nr:nucleotidyltransferase domain-containing protein [Armatimonadota bacterium]